MIQFHNRSGIVNFLFFNPNESKESDIFNFIFDIMQMDVGMDGQRVYFDLYPFVWNFKV